MKRSWPSSAPCWRHDPDMALLLFLCDNNSARSPLAEAIARHLRPDVEVWSAGKRPSHVRPEVKQVLREMSIDAAFLRARAIGETPFEEATLLVTLAPEADCPGAKLPTRRVSWPLPDPSSSPPEERLEAYRATRDELLRRLPALLRGLD